MSSLPVARELWRELDYVYSDLSIARDVKKYVTGLFREADTPAKHAHLTVAFLSGVLPRTPLHMEPPNQETDEIAADLIALNRAGFLTKGSQPTRPNQKAYIDGLVDARWVPALREALAREGDLCFFFEGDPERESYVVTRRMPEQEEVTTLGCDHRGWVRQEFENFFPHQDFFDTHVFAWVAAKEAGGVAPHPAVTVARILGEAGAPSLVFAPSLFPVAKALFDSVYDSGDYSLEDEDDDEDDFHHTAVTAAVLNLFVKADTIDKFAALNVAYIRGVLPVTPLIAGGPIDYAELSDGLVALNRTHHFLTMQSLSARPTYKAYVAGMVDARLCGGLQAALLREPDLYFYVQGFTNAPLVNKGYPTGWGNLWGEENEEFRISFPPTEFHRTLTYVWVAKREFGDRGEHPVFALARILQQLVPFV